MKHSMYLILFLYIHFSQLNGLELNRVILASDDNPFYIEFWPVVARVWSALGLRPTLALIASDDCVVDTSLGDVIRFEPLLGIPKAMQTQVYRLFLPALFPEEGCIISDIDMIPIAKSYFLQSARPCPDEGFLVFRDRALAPSTKQYPMCYVAAKGKIFGSVFRIDNISQFSERIFEAASLYYAWETDQLLLFRHVNEWEQRGGKVIRLGHTVGPRLDRANWKKFSKNEIEQAIDCHCPRPYSAHRDAIDTIVQVILETNRKRGL